MQKTDFQKQKGFSVPELVVTALVIGALAGVGFMYYQYVKQSAITTHAAPNQTSTSNQQTSTQPSPTVGYLIIKEWGVKLPLSDAIKDAYYIPSATIADSDGTPEAIWLSTTTLTNNNCTLSNSKQDGGNAIGELARIKPGQTDGVTGEPLTQEYPNGTTIGNYYYAYKSTKIANTCTSSTIASQADTNFAAATTNSKIQASSTN